MKESQRKAHLREALGGFATPGGYFATHNNLQKEDKKAVADYVVKNLVKEGDSVALDSGSSPTCVAEVLFRSRTHDSLSILTHNMQVFGMFIGQGGDTTNQLILTGGAFDPIYNGLFGVQTEDAYETFNPRLVILGVSGITATIRPKPKSGVYCHAAIERRVKEILFSKPTHRRIVLADWTKFGTIDSYMCGSLLEFGSGAMEVATIVTTKPSAGASEPAQHVFRETLNALHKMGVDVKCVAAEDRSLKTAKATQRATS